MPRGQDELHAKKAAGLLKCEELAETPGKPADPNAGVRRQGRRPSSTAASSRPRAASRSSRTRTRTTASRSTTPGGRDGGRQLRRRASSTAIDPPPLDQTKCGAGKKKCVSKYLTGLLKCRRRADAGEADRSEHKGLHRQGDRRSTAAASTPRKAASRSSRAKNPNDCQIPTRQLGGPAGPRLRDACASTTPLRRPRPRSEHHDHAPGWGCCRARSPRRPAASTTT